MHADGQQPMHAVSRRKVLQLCGAALAGSLSHPARPAGESGWIDVHHHFIPPGYREFFEHARAPDGSPAVVPPTTWDLKEDLEDMDRSGASTAILSIFVPPQLGTSSQRAQLARTINEYAARLATDHKGRFGSFAALPFPDIDTTLAEIAYASDTLHADGFAVYSNLWTRWIGDPIFDPIFAELHRRRAILFVHPTTAACCGNLVPGIPDNIIEYATDTTRAIASVVFNGVTSRYPGIRFIFSHGGGTVPYLVERFLGGTSAEIVPGIPTTGQRGPYVPHQPERGALIELRRLYYDTAQCANPLAMQALRTLVPTTQILYGTDYFYRTGTETAQALRRCAIFSQGELEAIGAGNSRRLLSRWAAPRAQS